MAVQILSQSYGPRKPLIECTADSLGDLEGLVCAEGSKATVGGTEYVLDRVNGWVEPGSGGGGGVLVVNVTGDEETLTLDKTWQEIYDAMPLAVVSTASDGGVYSYWVRRVFQKGGAYVVSTNDDDFVATSSDGFPALDGAI